MPRVLVADDSETILLLLRTRLELAGYEVETAADGQEVTERLQGSEPDSRPDLLLLAKTVADAPVGGVCTAADYSFRRPSAGRVETTVAIEFAASWNPFMKSNASASATRNTSTSNDIGTVVMGLGRACA